MGRRRVMTTVQGAEAAKLKEKGYSWSRLSEKYGVSISAVRNAVKRSKRAGGQAAPPGSVSRGQGEDGSKPSSSTGTGGPRKVTSGIKVKPEIVTEEEQPSIVKKAKAEQAGAEEAAEAEKAEAMVWERWRGTIELAHLWGINTLVLNHPEFGDQPLSLKDSSDRMVLENVGEAWVATLQYYFPNIPEGSPVLLLALAYGAFGLQVVKKRGKRPEKPKKKKPRTEELSLDHIEQPVEELGLEPEVPETPAGAGEPEEEGRKRRELTKEEMDALASRF